MGCYSNPICRNCGGLLVLINQQRALTMGGYAIQFVGATIISLVAGTDGLIIGFFLLVIGSGISKTDSLALFAKVHQKSKYAIRP